MGRSKHRYRKVVTAAAMAAAAPQGQLGIWLPEQGEMAYSGQGITAADYSEARGFIYFPNLKGVDQFKGYSRQETIRRSQWLTWNVGPARVLHKLARWVGAIGITPATGDRKWNKLAAAWWRNKYERSRLSYALTRRHTVSEWLVNNTFLTLRDGDALAVRARDDKGAPAAGIYESLLCEAGGLTGFSEGIRLSPHYEHLAYAVRNEDARDKATVLDAAHCHLFANPETHANVRGTPALVHAVNRLLDYREIDNAMLSILKAHQLVSWAFVKEAGTPNAAIRPVSGASRKTTIPADRAGSGSEGTTTAASKRIINDVFGSGEFLDLPPGVKPEKMTDGRDFPAEAAVKADIYHQLALGLGLPVELLFMLDKLTGPGVRFVLRQAQGWREWWLDQQVSWLVPDYAMRLEHALRTRELPECKDPYFWRHSIRYPAAITIDDGRDARAQIARLEGGLTTWEDEYGEQGDDWREKVEQRVEELRYASELLAAANVPAELFFTKLRPDLAADKEEEPAVNPAA